VNLYFNKKIGVFYGMFVDCGIYIYRVILYMAE